MLDAIAVNMTTHNVRLLGENKTERNAEAIISMKSPRYTKKQHETQARTGRQVITPNPRVKPARNALGLDD